MPMKYVHPSDVVSPKKHFTLITVLHDEGSGAWALALGKWKNSPVLAMRWNGNKESPIGNPQSRGLPTWFIIPEEYNESILGMKIISPDKLTLARNFLPAA